jgi:surface polysaccharide O-acyltransferase-like enzyme
MTFFKGRFYRIVLPWIIWALLYTLWFAGQKSTQINLYDFVQLYYQTFLGHFWFLPMLFGLYFLTPLIWKFLQVAKEKDILYAISVWFILLSVVPFLQHIVAPEMVLSSSYVLIHSGYYLMGYFIVTSHKKFAVNLLLLGYIVNVGINTLGQGLVPLLGRLVNFFMQNISPFIVLATTMLFTFIHQICLKFEKDLSKNFEAGTIFLSGISMGVFFVHGLVIYLFDMTAFGKAVSMLALPYFVAVPIRAIIIFTLSGVVVVLLRKLPVLKILASK